MGGPERQMITAEEAKKYKHNPLYNTYTESVQDVWSSNPDTETMGTEEFDADPAEAMVDKTFKEVDRKFLAEMSQTKWAKKKGPSHQAASFGSKGKFASDNALADATPWVGDTAPSDYTKSIKGDIEGYLQKWRERHGYSS